MSEQVMGPPARGPLVRVKGRGIDVHIRVDDEIDAEIVRMAMEIADRRRFGRAK